MGGVASERYRSVQPTSSTESAARPSPLRAHRRLLALVIYAAITASVYPLPSFVRFLFSVPGLELSVFHRWISDCCRLRHSLTRVRLI